MPRRARGWTCTRQTAGQRCYTLNAPGTRKCKACGKARPKKSKPKHAAALNYDYEHYREINGGPNCGICGRTAAEAQTRYAVLARDHAHTTSGLGEPRGLLCTDCNRHLGPWYTLARVEAMAAYLRRHEERVRGSSDALTED